MNVVYLLYYRTTVLTTEKESKKSAEYPNLRQSIQYPEETFGSHFY